MRAMLFMSLILVSIFGKAQELFSMTEPASNIPAGSIAVRVDNWIMDEIKSSRINYHLIPEISVGISKKLMLRGSVFFSNRNDQFRGEGASIYAKYRFLSNDAVQRHFRMAVFGTVSYNNSDIHQEEINLNGHNTGFEIGIVSTQLLRRLALSSAISFVKASDNGNNNKFVYGSENSRAMNISFSAGRLMFPRNYRDYRQTNINLMIETLCQVNMGSDKYYLDVAPTVQFIFNSQSRIDIGYKKQINTDLLRTAPNGLFIRVEYLFFNAF